MAAEQNQVMETSSESGSSDRTGISPSPAGPYYVPPPPPPWLPSAIAIVLLVIAAAVGRDIVRSNPTLTITSAVAAAVDLDNSGLVAADGDEPGAGAADGGDGGNEPDAVGIDAGDGAGGEHGGAESDEYPADGYPEAVTASGWGSVEGLLTFRGNPTRTFHGVGPVPTDPEVLWSAEIGCSESSVGSETKEWCGTGWTGQPLVFPRDDRWWVAVGGYNRSVNFFDPETGATVYPRFETGDIIKGTATVDPDGYPLLYTGSRDNFLRVVAIDGAEPVELWRLSANSPHPTLWNNDWDGSPLVIDDQLIVGGENSRFYVVKLNRAYGPDGRVTVDPEIVFDTAGWDDELLSALGDRQVSIENSVAVHDSVAYFANSGGLVQGWDLRPLAAGGEPEQVFRYWVGDDTDATLVVGEDGHLYVASEYERRLARATELGQVFRLDPSRPDDPLVWSAAANSGPGIVGGVWATPALWNDIVIIATDDGRVLGLDRATGATRWTLSFEGPVWSSPVVVDDVLIQGDCTIGMQAFDLTETTADGAPQRLWSVPLDGCVESTPAVWDGKIYVGSRGGSFYALGDVDR